MKRGCEAWHAKGIEKSNLLGIQESKWGLKT